MSKPSAPPLEVPFCFRDVESPSEARAEILSNYQDLLVDYLREGRPAPEPAAFLASLKRALLQSQEDDFGRNITPLLRHVADQPTLWSAICKEFHSAIKSPDDYLRITH